MINFMLKKRQSFISWEFNSLIKKQMKDDKIFKVKTQNCYDRP